MAKKLFIITGDYSGDMHAANVVRELRKLQPDMEIEAVGGENLKALGVPLLADQSKMGRVGFGSVLGAPYHFFLGRRILKRLESFKPDAVLHIDYGVFNLWMAKQIKQRGYKTLYFIPPQIWATRKGRIKQIQAGIDHVFCIFPFEEPLYQSHNVPVTYVGHPLVGELPPPLDEAGKIAFCKRHHLDPARPIIGVFPGSRKLEIDYLLKSIVHSIPLIRQVAPEAQFAIAKAGSLNDAFFKERLCQAYQGLQQTDIEAIRIVENENHATLSASDAVIAKSGTTTLEAALYDKPMILMYKLHPLVYQIALRMAYLPCIGLPNILTDVHNPIVKELWQDHVTPSEIASAVHPLLNPASPEVQKQRAGFAAIRNQLAGNAPANVAQGILSQLNLGRPEKLPV